MSKIPFFFNLSMKFQNTHFIAFCACLAAVTLYSLLFLIFPYQNYLSGLTMAIIISLLVGYALGHLVMVFNKEMKRQVELNKVNNQVKSQLLNILSHDVKGPLNNIQRLLKMTQSDVVSADELPHLLSQLQKDIDNTLILSQNLIRWIKVKEGDYQPALKMHSLVDLVNETINLYRTMAENKRIAIKDDIDRGEILTDAEMFKIVLRNLLSNAIKYSPYEGEVRISSQIDDKQTIICVEDEGTGIEKERLNNILSLHHSIESLPGTHNEKGTGLGLDLCQNIIQKLNGQLWVKSRKAEGSTFCFALPRMIHSDKQN
ncbi:MAG: HAMP domain-containing sensor histidine kinase [Fulvivirga sp.]|nr:HAMP domain-containing sensor histidine kinase [Fulvivirga sp.]